MTIPSNLRVPFVAVEFDSSQANQGPALLNYRALLIGQKTSGGSATANTLHLVTSADNVATLAGRASLLHRQAIAFFSENQSTECWIGVLADDAGGAAATGEIDITGPATAAGTLALYLGGELVSVGVAKSDSAVTIATAATAAINANTNLPVTATQGANPNDYKITLTARHKGAVYNSYDVRANYQASDALPAGVGVTVTPMASGTTNPSLTALITAMGDSWFHVIANPYTDATSLTAIETELTSRSGPLRMIDGLAITAADDTAANLATLGNGRNSSHVCIMGTRKSPTPPSEVSASVAGVVALEGAADPARPFQTLPLTHVKAPAESDLLTLQERNTLLYAGISPTKTVTGTVQMERLITTYKTNAAGSADTAYLDATTLLTLMYGRFAFRVRMARYSRHKLASDGIRVGAGQAIMTPALGKAEALLWFRDMEALGLFENFADFKANLVVQRSALDPTRLDFLLPPNLVNAFVVGAGTIQFRL